jgi:hypothetical protein
VRCPITLLFSIILKVLTRELGNKRNEKYLDWKGKKYNNHYLQIILYIESPKEYAKNTIRNNRFGRLHSIQDQYIIDFPYS